jgi:hypothetical protein
MTDKMLTKLWNAKILKTTMKIQEEYPELSKYLEEMPLTIPSNTNPEISEDFLKTYHESLVEVLNNYIIEHPKGRNEKKGKPTKEVDLEHELPDPNNPNEIQGFPDKEGSDTDEEDSDTDENKSEINPDL